MLPANIVLLAPNLGVLHQALGRARRLGNPFDVVYLYDLRVLRRSTPSMIHGPPQPTDIPRQRRERRRTGHRRLDHRVWRVSQVGESNAGCAWWWGQSFAQLRRASNGPRTPTPYPHGDKGGECPPLSVYTTPFKVSGNVQFNKWYCWMACPAMEYVQRSIKTPSPAVV